MAIIPILVAVFIVQVWPVLAQKIGFERGDARWVSNTKLCDQGNTEHGSSGYIRVPMTNEPDGISNPTSCTFPLLRNIPYSVAAITDTHADISDRLCLPKD